MSVEHTRGDEAPGGGGKWSLSPGDEIGGYRVTKPLGKGGMGEVYLVEHVGMGKRYAMKLLSPEHSRDSAFRDRFRVEARIMADLDHPNIVQVHNMGEDNGRFFLVMDYVESASDARPLTLGELMKRRALKADEARSLAMGIARALDYAHTFGEGPVVGSTTLTGRRGVVHRDLKPGNVLIGPDGRVRVSDFGLAKVMGEEYLKSVLDKSVSLSMSEARTAVRESEGTGGLTQSDGAVLGTFEYMAPEQKEGRADARSDLYSLGLITYRMLTGKRPEGRFPDPSKLGCPEWWDGVIERTLAPDPEDRYASAAELLKELERKHYPKPPARPARAPAQPGSKGASSVLLPVVVLVAILAVGALYTLLSIKQGPSPPDAPPFVPFDPGPIDPTFPINPPIAPHPSEPPTPEEEDAKAWTKAKVDAVALSALGEYDKALEIIKRFLDSAKTVKYKPLAVGLYGEIEQRKIEADRQRSPPPGGAFTVPSADPFAAEQVKQAIDTVLRPPDARRGDPGLDPKE
ncbi:MAG: serine/threonine protein kinase, partial [Planctomycetota bacterium]